MTEPRNRAAAEQLFDPIHSHGVSVYPFLASTRASALRVTENSVHRSTRYLEDKAIALGFRCKNSGHSGTSARYSNWSLPPTRCLTFFFVCRGKHETAHDNARAVA